MMYPGRSYVELGSLLSLSIDYFVHARTIAALVDRILRGTKPADLPVEQPMAFDFGNQRQDGADSGDHDSARALRAWGWVVQ